MPRRTAWRIIERWASRRLPSRGASGHAFPAFEFLRPLALASTLRAPAPASPLPRPQRAARLPLRGALELHAACRAGRGREKSFGKSPATAKLPDAWKRGEEVGKSHALGRLAGRRRTPEAPPRGRRRNFQRSITRHLARKPRDALGRRAAGQPQSNGGHPLLAVRRGVML